MCECVLFGFGGVVGWLAAEKRAVLECNKLGGWEGG